MKEHVIRTGWHKTLHGTTLGTELIIHYTGLGRGLYRITQGNEGLFGVM